MEKDAFRQICDTVRRFTRERLVPLEQKVEEEDDVPPETVQEMRDLGLFGLNIPEEYGGLGLTLEEEVDIILELTWASAAFRSVISMNIGAGMQGLVSDGTEEQKSRWLPRIASGEVISAFALTEPDSGSDAGALLTRAIRKDDGFVLNGTKRWVTNAPQASLITVMARTAAERMPNNEHVSAFLIPRDSIGVTIGPKVRKMGQNGSALADVFLDDVFVPADAVIGGQTGRGFATAMKAVNRNRINIAAVCIGQARRILHEALTYSIDRKQFGRPICKFQLIQAMLADSQTELDAAEALLRETARCYDAGVSTTRGASSVKMFASEMVGRLADNAVQILGGAGYMRESVVERLYRDVRVFRIYGGTTQIQQLIIAGDMVKCAIK